MPLGYSVITTFLFLSHGYGAKVVLIPCLISWVNLLPMRAHSTFISSPTWHGFTVHYMFIVCLGLQEEPVPRLTPAGAVCCGAAR